MSNITQPVTSLTKVQNIAFYIEEKLTLAAVGSTSDFYFNYTGESSIGFPVHMLARILDGYHLHAVVLEKLIQASILQRPWLFFPTKKTTIFHSIPKNIDCFFFTE